MTWFEFFANIAHDLASQIGSFAWPLVVFVIALLFKNQIVAYMKDREIISDGKTMRTEKVIRDAVQGAVADLEPEIEGPCDTVEGPILEFPEEFLSDTVKAILRGRPRSYEYIRKRLGSGPDVTDASLDSLIDNHSDKFRRTTIIDSGPDGTRRIPGKPGIAPAYMDPEKLISKP